MVGYSQVFGFTYCRYLAALLLCAGLAMLPYGLAAQDASPAPTISRADTLSEVMVKGLRAQPRQLPLSPVQTLSGSALEQLNSLSVADAMRYFSGVQMKDYGGIGGLKTVDIRSLGASHTAVFYDGLQLGNAQNGQTDLGKFSLDNMEMIELYNAQKAVLLQPARAYAAGNAIYLQSKTPRFKGDERDHLRLTARTGSFGLINPSFLWQHKISERVYSSVSTEWQKAHGRYKFRYTNSVYDTTATRQNSDVEAFRVEAGLHGILADSSKWSFKVYQYLSERGLPPAIISNRFQSEERQRDRNTFLQSSFQKSFGRQLDVLLNAKFAYDYQRYLDPVYDNIEGELDNRYKQQEYYVSAAARYRLSPFWDASLSGDFQLNKLDADLYRFSYPTRYTKLLALASDLHKGPFRLQASLLGTFLNEKVKENAAPEAQRRFSPALTLAVQPFPEENLSLRAFYKNVFRMPTFNDLHYTFVGNTSLKPEYTHQYNIGFSYGRTLSGSFWREISLQADAFYNEVKDKIVAQPSENLFRWRMMNLGEVEIKGIESSLQVVSAPADRLTLRARLTHTYQQALDVTNPRDFNYRHQIAYTPRHSGSFTLAARWADLWINYSYIYTGERYSQKANIAVNYMEPWYTHDVSASCLLKAKKLNYRLSAELNNVFNQYHDVVLNFPMPGRNYRLSLTLNY